MTKSQLDHLNQEEKEHVIEIVREFTDIYTRPYRFSTAQKKEIERVMTKMKTEGAIQNSKSP